VLPPLLEVVSGNEALEIFDGRDEDAPIACSAIAIKPLDQ